MISPAPRAISHNLKDYFMKILLIEDNVKLNEAVKTYLVDSGFEVESVFNGVQGVNKIKDDKKQSIFYEIIILDRMMPMKDGLEVLKEIKDFSPNSGVIMLTARDTVEDRVTGLSAGADDYMVKPFDVKELIARIHSLYRRLQKNKLQIDDLTNGQTQIADSEYKSEKDISKNNFGKQNLDFNFHLNEIQFSGQKIILTSKESAIFKLLLDNKMTAVSKDLIFEKIWSENISEKSEDFNPRQIDVHVHNLRNKLSKINFPAVIETIRGVGYKIIF